VYPEYSEESMARTLSDTIIIAMIEATTRLASGRGAIAGSAATPAAQKAQTGEAGGTGATTENTVATNADSAESIVATSGDQASAQRSAPAAGERDTRSAEEIGVDFKTIYRHIEEVVKSSAEQETKSVGFSVR
jgi:hypothetical protein